MQNNLRLANKSAKKLTTAFVNSPFTWLIAGGIIGGSVFSYSLSPWLLPIAIFPLILSFYSGRKLTFRQSLVSILAFFVPYFAVVLKWFIDADISGLSGVSRRGAITASIASIMIITTVFIICSLPLALFIKTISGNQASKKRVFELLVMLPAVWVVCEWLRSWGFSVIAYGKNGTLGDFWNFGSIGLGMMNTPLAPLSKLIGMYGLSFLVVLIASLFIMAYKSKDLRLRLTFASLILLIIASVIVSNHYWSSKASSVYHGSVEQIENLAPHFFRKNTIEDFDPAAKDLIVLPEYSGIFDHGFDSFANTYINDRLGKDGVSINVAEGPNLKHITTLELRGNKGELIDSQTKQLLIPTGEYLPYIVSGYYRLSGQTKLVDRFNNTRANLKGDPPKVFSANSFKIGPVSCSGILGRQIYRNLTREGAGVLTNSASLIIFNRSKSYFYQSLMMAKFHAVANNRVFIQASKGAPAFVIDGNGSYIVKPGNVSDKFIDFKFKTNKSLTPFSYLGEWILLFSGAILVGYLLVQIRNKY